MSFYTWDQYFKNNRSHFDHLNWKDIMELSVQEKTIISSSISQFQRGEHSEGKHFMQYAGAMNDISYSSAVKTFICEEQDHAMVLGRFMDHHQIPRLKKDDWLDSVFRRLRKLAGLEGTITVLLTAEIISMVYYQALKKCTSSSLLQNICDQILVDEKMHLQFQCVSLYTLYKRKIPVAVVFSRAVHALLMAGTIVMVWFWHKKVLAKGGYVFFSFLGAVWSEFRLCRDLIRKGQPAFPLVNAILPPTLIPNKSHL